MKLQTTWECQGVRGAMYIAPLSQMRVLCTVKNAHWSLQFSTVNQPEPCSLSSYTASLLRPLALRRLSTLRPPLDLILKKERACQYTQASVLSHRHTREQLFTHQARSAEPKNPWKEHVSEKLYAMDADEDACKAYSEPCILATHPRRPCAIQ